MATPTFTMRQLLEAGVHFGHHTRRWNPKMEPYIFGERNGIHILDLQQTMPLLGRALEAMRTTVANGGRILFVGTKRAASDKIAEAAKACGQYYVNHRWLGGMLTNWATVSQSIKRLRDLEERLASEEVNQLGKKEILQLTRERDKLEMTLGGIKEMGDLPDMLFVLDTTKEDIAVLEANKLGIPVVAVIDSNASPVGIDFPIPGNDDAMRSITLYCDLTQGAVLDGLQAEMMARGSDLGSAETPPQEPTLATKSDTAEDEQSAKKTDDVAVSEAVGTDATEAAGTKTTKKAVKTDKTKKLSASAIAKKAVKVSKVGKTAKTDDSETDDSEKAVDSVVNQKTAKTAKAGKIGEADTSEKAVDSVAVENDGQTDAPKNSAPTDENKGTEQSDAPESAETDSKANDAKPDTA